MLTEKELLDALASFEHLLGYIPRNKKALAFTDASVVESALRHALREVRESKPKTGNATEGPQAC